MLAAILSVMLRTTLGLVLVGALAACDGSAAKDPAPDQEAPSLVAPGQTLPRVPFALPEFKGVNKVFVTKTGIVSNEQTVATIENGAIDPSAVHGHLVAPLFDRLDEEVERPRRLPPSPERSAIPTS